MALRIVVYGWAIPEDRFLGPGSGTFVDLTYFVDDDVTVGEILDMINMNGFKFVPLRYPEGHPRQGDVIQDKVSIDELDIGIEPMPDYEDEQPIQTLTTEELISGGYYGNTI
jgi:hypothetical protein